MAYKAAKGVSASSPATKLPGVETKKQPDNGLQVKWVDISAEYTSAPPVKVAQGETLYSLYLHLPEGIDKGSWSYDRHREIMKENTDLTLLGGTPLDPVAGSSARLKPFDPEDYMDIWQYSLNPVPGGDSHIIGGLLVVSSAPYEDLVNHLGWLSIIQLEADPEEAESFSESQEGLLVASTTVNVLEYYPVNGANLVWMALFADADTARKIMEPLGKLYIHYPFAGRTEKLWLEISMNKNGGPAQKLGRDPLLTLEPDMVSAVRLPYMKQEITANVHNNITKRILYDSGSPFRQIDDETRRQMVSWAIDMTTEAEIIYRDLVLIIVYGLAEIGFNEENCKATKEIFSNKSLSLWDRVDEFEDWVDEMLSE